MTAYLRNRLLPMLVAIVLVFIGSLPLAFLNDNVDTNWLIYVVVPLQGIGLVINLNTATSLIPDVIGSDTANSAFVYGCYSLFDKVANGIGLFFIVANFSKNASALKNIITFIPIACSLLAYLFTWIGQRYFSHKMAKITGIQAT